MPTQILAIGTTAADSADQVVSAGTPLTGPAVGDLATVDATVVNLMPTFFFGTTAAGGSLSVRIGAVAVRKVG